MTELKNKQINKWMNKKNKQIKGWLNKRMNRWMNEWMHPLLTWSIESTDVVYPGDPEDWGEPIYPDSDPWGDPFSPS